MICLSACNYTCDVTRKYNPNLSTSMHHRKSLVSLMFKKNPPPKLNVISRPTHLHTHIHIQLSYFRPTSYKPQPNISTRTKTCPQSRILPVSPVDKSKPPHSRTQHVHSDPVLDLLAVQDLRVVFRACCWISAITVYHSSAFSDCVSSEGG